MAKVPASTHPPAPSCRDGNSVKLQDAVSLLMGRVNYERTSHIPYGEQAFKLDRMHNLAQKLDNPQDTYPIVHVAGSKGKGSTATMIASILSAAGYRTGLFTSPHLQRLNERIVIDGQEIESMELERELSQVMPVVLALDEEAMAAGRPYDKPTFFEIITALALVHFRNQQVQAVVLEVGLGGRLDSTNICAPVCSVITSIGLDHTRHLGETHALIAGEKAGIIKPGVPVVSAVAHPEALPVILDRAAALGSEVWSSEADFEFEYDSQSTCKSVHFRLNSNKAQVAPREYASLELGMLGRHQARNAACAVMATAVLQQAGFDISEVQLRTGLSKAICRGRIEVVSRNPAIVLDTAHNVASIEALIATLAEEFDVPREERIVLFAATRGKDVSQMLARLMTWCGQLVVTRYQENPRGMATDRLLELAGRIEMPAENRPVIHVAVDPGSAWQAMRDRMAKSSLVCITGSFFLAAEVEPLIRG